MIRWLSGTDDCDDVDDIDGEMVRASCGGDDTVSGGGVLAEDSK